MNLLKITSAFLSTVLVFGCASVCPSGGPRGPELVTSGRMTETGQYAEVGVEFTTWGDFVAVASPKRWASPIATGGMLSWLNPGAWSEDAGRTGRILLGEAVVIGGAAAATASGGNSGSTEAAAGGGTSGSGGTPTPPASIDGTVPPPPETN